MISVLLMSFLWWGSKPPIPTCIEVTGEWQGTLGFQASIGKQTYLPLMVKDRKTGLTANATTVNGVWEVPTYIQKQKADLRVAFLDAANGDAHIRYDLCSAIDTKPGVTQ